jgi:hypothetical protein
VDEHVIGNDPGIRAQMGPKNKSFLWVKRMAKIRELIGASLLWFIQGYSTRHLKFDRTDEEIARLRVEYQKRLWSV